MSARILPREEWYRLDAESVAFFETIGQDDLACIVVEDGDAIVARMAVMRVPHFERFWMAPEVVGNAGITRALLRAATEKAAEWAPFWFYANADNDTMCDTLERLGGQWLPIHTYLLFPQRVQEKACQRQ